MENIIRELENLNNLLNGKVSINDFKDLKGSHGKRN